MKLKEFGFKKISKEKYLEMMKDETFENTMDMSNETWFLHEGDLITTPKQLEILYSNDYSYLVAGNLVVDGVLSYQGQYQSCLR